MIDTDTVMKLIFAFLFLLAIALAAPQDEAPPDDPPDAPPGDDANPDAPPDAPGDDANPDAPPPGDDAPDAATPAPDGAASPAADDAAAPADDKDDKTAPADDTTTAAEETTTAPDETTTVKDETTTAKTTAVPTSTEGSVFEATLTIDPFEPPPDNVVTDTWGQPIKGIEMRNFEIAQEPEKHRIVVVKEEHYRTFYTRPPTKPNCMCLTRGPLSRFKLIGNLHFIGIKRPPKQFYTTENPYQTICPPCNCDDCFTTESSSTERPVKPPCGK